MVLKVLVLLINEKEVVHSRQFKFRPVADAHRIVKKKHHLLHSREEKLIEIKKCRSSNRTSIVSHTSYYLQYEAYELNTNETIHFVGV